jgi:hypothetical protein
LRSTISAARANSHQVGFGLRPAEAHSLGFGFPHHSRLDRKAQLFRTGVLGRQVNRLKRDCHGRSFVKNSGMSGRASPTVTGSMYAARSPQSAAWLDDDQAVTLIDVDREAGVPPEQAVDFGSRFVDGHAAISPHQCDAAKRRGEALLKAYRRVRQGSRLKGVSRRVEPRRPPDVPDISVFLPKLKAGR